MKKTTPIGFAVAMATLAVIEPALAEVNVDEPVPVFEFKKVTVSATRIEKNSDDVKRDVTVVDAEKIEQIQAQSLAETLKYETGISVSGGPRAGSQTVNIRGLSGSKVLQVVDGVRQVFESGHRPSYFLEPELLKRIEVIKGPVSSLWGSGAIGGVVAQSTINAADILKPEQNIGGFVKTGYNDNNHQSSTTVALGSRIGAVDMLLSGYYQDANDIELGDGNNLLGSSSRDSGELAKLEWQITDNQALGFNFRHSESKGQVPTNSSAVINTTSNFLINRYTQTDNIAFDYSIKHNSLLDANLKLYYTNVDMSEERVQDGRDDETELSTYGLSLSNVSRVKNMTFLYGIDGYQSEFNSNRGGINRPLPPEATSEVLGAFVQGEFELPLNFALEAGLRYDSFSVDADNLNIDSSDSKVSPSVALSWSALEWAQFIVRYDSAFRAPSAEEMFTTGTHFCLFGNFCNRFVSNPDLEAEDAENKELVARFTFADVIQNDQLIITASAYQNDVDNFIQQIVTNPIFFPVMDAGNTTWVNVDEAKITGFEVSSTYQQEALSLSLSYSRARGEDKQTGNDLTDIPADTVIAQMNYAFFDNQLKTGLNWRYSRHQKLTDYPENTTNKEYDSYKTTDIYLSYKPHAIEQLTLMLSVNNLEDNYYTKAWAELPEAGREVIISAKYEF